MERLEEMLSVTQAAQYLGVERKTIYDAIKAQRLAASRFMGKTAVKQSDLDAFRDKELRPNIRRGGQIEGAK
ncbi:MAG: helix-turn-helix domain-containing protein [Armatimonadota bacterium]